MLVNDREMRLLGWLGVNQEGKGNNNMLTGSVVSKEKVGDAVGRREREGGVKRSAVRS